MGAKEAIKKYGLSSKTWTQKGTHAVLHYYFPVAEEPITPLRDYFGDGYELCTFFISENFARWSWNDEDMVRLREKFVALANKDPKVIPKLRSDWGERLKEFDKMITKIKPEYLLRLNDDKLLKEYSRVYQAYIQEYGISIGIQDAFSMQSDRFLEPAFMDHAKKNRWLKDFHENYGVLMSPVTPSFVQREYLDLLKIAKNGTSRREFRRELKKHADKWHFINNNYAKVIRLDEKFFEQRLLNMPKNIKEIDKEIACIKSSFEDIKQRKQKLIKKLRLTKGLETLIKIAESFAETQDTRKMYVMISNYYQSLFLKEVARRTNYSYEELEYSVYYEMKDALQGKLSKDLLKKRRQSCLVLFTSDGYKILRGKDAKDLYKGIFESKERGKNELTGTVASSGYAKGNVKIVMKTHDLLNFNKGDILVSTMTRPEMTVAMKKAAAIVTDEGGVTSHAAVVSRELKIPCIIGTKHATKIFKDGDMIEVDANSGTVRKL